MDLGGYLKAGIDPEALSDAMDRLNDQLAALRRRRDDIARLVESGEVASRSLNQLGKLAATAAGRLAHADLAMQAEELALLDVRVTVLDRARTPALRVEGVICSPGSRGSPRRGSGPASAR